MEEKPDIIILKQSKESIDMKGFEKMIYGYIRVSSKKQKSDRQEKNIKEKYPNAVIYIDKFTGTQMNRLGSSHPSIFLFNHASISLLMLLSIFLKHFSTDLANTTLYFLSI